MLKTSIIYVEFVLLMVAFIWGVNPPVMKIGLLYLAPMPYNSLRMLIAIVISWLFVGVTKTYRPVDRQDVKSLLLISLVGFFVFQLFFTVGVQNTTAGNASLLLGLLPVSVAIINRIYKIESITPQIKAGIAVSLTGVILIVVGSGKEMSLAGNHLRGALMLLIAQFGYGYYTVFSKGLMQKYSAYQVTAYVITISGLLFLLISLPEMLTIQWERIPLSGWLSTLYSGIFALCIGNFLWVWGVGKIGSAKASLFNNLSPVFAIATGYIMLGETFGLLQLFGAFVISAGLYLTRNKKVFPHAENKER